MVGRRAAAGLALAALGLTAAGCLGGGTKTVTTTRTETLTATRTITRPSGAEAAPCTGSQLSATFTVVAGSEGAGQIAYLLSVQNTSQSRCYVFGLPEVELMAGNGSSLPTHVAAAQSGTTGSSRVVLAPGSSAVAQARFSPDVAGPGDAQSGACQPKAATLRVTPDGGGSVDATVQPPTSVCERGTLYFDTFAPAT